MQKKTEKVTGLMHLDLGGLVNASLGRGSLAAFEELDELTQRLCWTWISTGILLNVIWMLNADFFIDEYK